MSTPYHAKYLAWELTKRCSSEKLGKLAQSLFNATVDLNPHQIEAALFAFRSPLSRGAILADEVGLGKTIEAGLVLSQLWAEKKRRILIILPAALREQWKRELAEKFFIDSIILESKNFNQQIKAGIANPFEHSDQIVLCSYHFAKGKSEYVQRIPWDLVVLDEAHRLRNVYRKDNKIARVIRDAIEGMPKILLTATPLQNSLMELFGLVSFIDPHVFGSEAYFRSEFSRKAGDVSAAEFRRLRERIQPICQRTLRRQVLEYIRYTNRISLTQDFTPTDEEMRLYEAVSAWLQRQDSHALPAGQRSLMTLVLRKILASSSFAIANTLGSMANRLSGKLAAAEQEAANEADIGDDYDVLSETRDEWGIDSQVEEAPSKADELARIRQEIEAEKNELIQFKSLAESITTNAKGEALLVALKSGLEKMDELGAARKALIFTESRRTQRYLKELLEANGYTDQVVTLSGTNTDPDSMAIYRDWMLRHEGQDVITGSKAVDVRSALVDAFREHKQIMIATESGAEGINLQFCSLLVNYDLPWNPQRIEQRIGRCHRYGQKFDVVVINFLNRKNAADQRVFELLSEKFHLFNGVFGASDEVLGALETGVDFEKRINEIYQSCRTPEDIGDAFDQLQLELDTQIQEQMEDTRAKLLENFDEEVHARLKLSRDETRVQVSQFEDWLWRFTRYQLADYAEFGLEPYTFKLRQHPTALDPAGIPLGQYRLVTHQNGETQHQYRLGHPLAERLLANARNSQLPIRELRFRYDQYEGKVSLVEQLQGKKGWLQLALLTIDALEREEHLVFSGITDGGDSLDTETCTKLFGIPAEEGLETAVSETMAEILRTAAEQAAVGIIQSVSERNHQYFEAEMDKLETWADDLKQGLERELKELDREIKAVKKEARQVADLQAKVDLHKQTKDLERKRNDKRRKLFEAQDEIDERKDELINQIEARLKQSVGVEPLFTVRWSVS
ncbi:MAG TPA: DEAD/DEAH box helicase [Gammaproteobacteria bacterium]|nr:DEAD/DEAH box helicase [Gammaproteobacteria bacterium]